MRRDMTDRYRRLGSHGLPDPPAVVVGVRLLDDVRPDQIAIEHDFRVAHVRHSRGVHEYTPLLGAHAAQTVARPLLHGRVHVSIVYRERVVSKLSGYRSET